MVFTPEAVVLHGGCNCQAIRYKISVPPFHERPKTPYRDLDADIGDLRIPMTVLDGCNDCRNASGSMLPMAIITDITTVSVQLRPQAAEPSSSSSPPKDPSAPAVDDAPATQSFDFTAAVPQANSNQADAIPATQAFDFTAPAPRANTALTFYKSSPARSRWFCSQCGTHLAYTVDEGVIPKEWGWPKMLDVWLGTLDREHLVKEWMKPERMFWSELGIGWVRELVEKGAGVPQHPTFKINEVC